MENNRKMNVEIRNLYGITNSNEKTIIPYIYDSIYKCYGKKPNAIEYEVSRNNKVGLFDSNGKVIIPCKYDKIFIEKNFYRVKENNK